MKSLYQIGTLFAASALLTSGLHAQESVETPAYDSPRAEMIAAHAESGARDAALKVMWGGGAKESSSYSGKIVPHTITEGLDKLRLTGYQWIGPSEGTGMNAELVTFHPTHLALGQGDVLDRLSGEPIPDKPGMTYDFTVLGEPLGYECLFLITQRENYQHIGHVVEDSWDLAVATGSRKSGSWGSWQIVREIYPDLEDMHVDHVGGSSDIIAAVQADPSVMGFMVMRPDPGGNTFEAIRNAGLSYIPVIDLDLEDEYGEPIEVRVANRGNQKKVLTSCTPIQLITGVLENIADPDGEGRREFKRLQATIKKWETFDHPDYASHEEFQQSVIELFTTWRDWTDAFVTAAQDTYGPIYDDIKDAVGG